MFWISKNLHLQAKLVTKQQPWCWCACLNIALTQRVGMQFTIGDKFCENTSTIKITNEKQEYLWALWRIRFDDIWCNLQMWTCLWATTWPEYSSPERICTWKCSCSFAANQWSKIWKCWVHFFTYIRYLLLFISMNKKVHFVFFLTCVFSGCCCYNGCCCLASKCQELK